MKFLLIIGIVFSFLFGEIGKVTALVGKGQVKRGNRVIPLKLGLKIEKNDTILTQDKTKVQIIFKDRTIITIGRNSKFNINDYLFDSSNHSKANFSLSKGIIKTLTGKIGKVAPRRFRIKTKNALIGIRGTIFVVEIENDITKLGMLFGQTFFQDLQTKKIYVVKTGEYLVFDIKKPKKVVIKKGFVEPESVKLQTKQNKKTKSKLQTTKVSLKKKIDKIAKKVEKKVTSSAQTNLINDKQLNKELNKEVKEVKEFVANTPVVDTKVVNDVRDITENIVNTQETTTDNKVVKTIEKEIDNTISNNDKSKILLMML